MDETVNNSILNLKWEDLYDDLADMYLDSPKVESEQKMKKNKKPPPKKTKNNQPRERCPSLVHKHTRRVWKLLFKHDDTMPWKKFKKRVSHSEYLKTLMVGNYDAELIKKNIIIV